MYHFAVLPLFPPDSFPPRALSPFLEPIGFLWGGYGTVLEYPEKYPHNGGFAFVGCSLPKRRGFTQFFC